MITTVSLNPAIDKTLLLSQYKHGEVNRLADARMDIGGKSINVAKLLHRLGIPVQVYGFIGGQNRPYVEELLTHEELSCHFLVAEGATRTNTKLVELDKGITTDLNEPGFYVKEEQLAQLKDLLIQEASYSDYTVLCGSLPKGLTDSTYRELILALNPHTKTVLDADGDLLVKGIQASPFLIKPNLHELESAFHRSFATESDIISFCRQLIHLYDICLVLVSMGENGSLLITQDSCYRAAPVKVVVKSTVGAGDSMIAGMLYGLSQDYSLRDTFAFATACATLAVTKEGTVALSLNEIQDMLKRVKISQLP